jgi:hypothetical protein
MTLSAQQSITSTQSINTKHKTSTAHALVLCEKPWLLREKLPVVEYDEARRRDNGNFVVTFVATLQKTRMHSVDEN